MNPKTGLALSATLFLAAVARPAHAYDFEGPADTAAFKQCMANAPGNLDERSCLEAELDRQNAVINAVYQTVMIRTGDPKQKADLRSAERAWIKRKDAKCQNAGNDFSGGSEQQTLIDACYVLETERRIVVLRQLIAGR